MKEVTEPVKPTSVAGIIRLNLNQLNQNQVLTSES